MSAIRPCSICEASLSDEVSPGCCPACLLLAGLDEESVTSVTPTTNMAGSVKWVAPTTNIQDARNSQVASVEETDPDRDSETTITPRLIRVKYSGDYKYDEERDEIARGGMGVVYRARQEPRPRCRLKMILAGRLASPEEIERFRREAEAAAQPRPPEHRADLRGRRARRPAYFSMKLIDGGSLAERLLDAAARPPRPPPGSWRRSPRPSTTPTSAGVLHRDLKPANILLDAGGRAARHRLRPGQAGRGRHGADPLGRDPRHARLHGPRAGRAATRRPRPSRPTSTAWARSSTSCSPAGRRSGADVLETLSWSARRARPARRLDRRSTATWRRSA